MYAHHGSVYIRMHVAPRAPTNQPPGRARCAGRSRRRGEGRGGAQRAAQVLVRCEGQGVCGWVWVGVGGCGGEVCVGGWGAQLARLARRRRGRACGRDGGSRRPRGRGRRRRQGGGRARHARRGRHGRHVRRGPGRGGPRAVRGACSVPGQPEGGARARARAPGFGLRRTEPIFQLPACHCPAAVSAPAHGHAFAALTRAAASPRGGRVCTCARSPRCRHFQSGRPSGGWRCRRRTGHASSASSEEFTGVWRSRVAPCQGEWQAGGRV